MLKLDTLSRLLVATVPEIAADPMKLQLFVPAGRIEARRGATLGYTYRYTLNVLVTEYAGEIDALVTPVLAWIAQYQPDLLTRPDSDPFRFEAERWDNQTYDVSLFIDLSENVAVERAGGAWSTTHLPEPPSIDMDDHFPGVCDARLWQLLMRDMASHDDEVARTADPAFTG